MTMADQAKFSLIVILLATAFAGCVNLKAPPDPTRYYLLNGAGGGGVIADPMNTGPVVRLAPIALDPYLDSRYMVLRLQEYEVQFSDIHRWGEELSDNIQRALAQDLVATGAAADIVTRTGEDADFVVSVHVHRFEGVPPDIAHLSVTWRLADATGRIIHTAVHDDRNIGWVFENYGHLAEKLDESLNNLAIAIGERLSAR